jgi:FkbM family methyltransferase
MLSGLISEIFFNETYPIQPTNNTLTIFDCGANIGMSTLYFKKMCPNALVSAFEPNPATYRYLQENIHSNHLKDVTTYMIGLGGTPGETTLYTDEKLEASSGASITRHLESKDKKTSEVTITIKKLSDYIDKKIDILKLDVEGAEGEVFDDLKRENKFALIENIYMEYHYDGIHTTYPLSKILSTLEESGFKYLIKSQFTKHISHYKNQIHAYIIIAWR